MSENGGQSTPPGPPKMQRRLSLYGYQRIAIPLLFLVPLIALFGVFDLTLGRVRGQTSGLDVTVTYPARIRYRQDATLEVTLRNASDVTLDSVRVTMDTAYLGAFSNTAFTPQLDDRHAVVLRDIVPGESRLLKGQLKAERYWNHSGFVHVQTSAADQPIELRFRTLILP